MGEGDDCLFEWETRLLEPVLPEVTTNELSCAFGRI